MMHDCKRMRPGFMGIGYYDEVDASQFIEAARQYGTIDLTEAEEASNKVLQEREKMDRDLSRCLATISVALGKTERATEDLLGLASEMDKKDAVRTVRSIEVQMEDIAKNLGKVKAKAKEGK